MALVKASKIVKKALEFVGCHDNPIGSKRIVFNESFFENPDYGQPGPDLGEGFNWNVQCLWYIFKICDASELFYGGEKTTSSKSIMDYYLEKQQVYDTPQVGDLALYHTGELGLVVSVLTPYSYDILLADVDWASDVRIRRRNTEALFLGFMRPNYLPEEPASVEGGEQEIIFRPVHDESENEEIDLNLPQYPLVRGDQGKDVNRLREILNELGFTDNDGNQLASTGKLGLKVAEAIEKFQTEYSLEVTGEYDESMYNKLREILIK